MAADAGEPIPDYRVAGRRIGDDVYRGFIQPYPRRVGEVIGLQAVRQIENNLTAIVRERERMRENVLTFHIPCKVVGFPIRTISRGMTFHDAVVAGDAGFVEPGAPDAHPRRALDISGDVYIQLLFQFAIGAR